MQIRFDFNRQPLQFSQPIRIIQTNRVDQVVAKLAEIEQATAAGFYAAGYLSYEAAGAFQPYYKTLPTGKMPLLQFGIFNQPCQTETELTQQPVFTNCHWQPEVSFEHYQQAIQRIRNEIAAGNTYQTNYTMRLNCDFTAEPKAFYHYLLQAQQANYCAFLDMADFSVLSASPELFFHWRDGVLTTRPMKGTAERGTTYADDINRRQSLANSEKDRAENVMIVDLLRNDMSQVARPGSVNVTALFDVEKYPTVWQMTSTITAHTRPEIGLTDILRALFPCGSITGAPKTSTMRLIADLESSAREVYCGAMGYITPQHEAIFSVPIRTVIVDKQQQTAQYGVGGGITWDSTALDEYQETINKAKVLRSVSLPQQLLESLLLENGRYPLIERHLQRLADSACYFDFNYDRQAIYNALELLSRQHNIGLYKVRLLLNKSGQLQLQAEPIKPLTEPLCACWADQPINSKNRLLYHKTTRRDHYPQASLTFERLLYNERDEITEFVNGNVALLIDDQWLTPPITSGLLPGTQRANLLEQNKLVERVVYRRDLLRAEKLAFFNSVRGWRDVIWQDTPEQ